MPPVVRVKKRARDAKRVDPNALPPYMTPAVSALPSPEPTQSLLWPAGDYDGEFVEPQLPDTPFMIQHNGDDNQTEGPYDPDNFTIDPETNIAYSSNYPGSPVYIRATDQEGSHLETIAGDGTPGTMDILPYDPDGDTE